MSGQYDSVGIMTEDDPASGYSIFEHYSRSIVDNVAINDPNLSSWSDYRRLLSGIKTACGFTTLDLIECNMRTDDYRYVFDTFSQEFSITVHQTNLMVGLGQWKLGEYNLIGM